ncbi:SirB1 family protein [Sphingomonas xinjiangensis]|uniref:Regulator of sirC expression with transglutaminase-like and TPR domain n=1 Tax=Sphingomonas xinjiangensis TaxID=643568 RepID=A0A840YRS1_9SPHN|nr:transglutaminase-like domain-containing protein [Sphingomonas xinjiangensis]MBB5712323.1 regulator of sirC expression with transglutaminase-like and TPR domain [Sphingomonas xinjiangensis]
MAAPAHRARLRQEGRALVEIPDTGAILELGLLEDEAISLDSAALQIAALDHAGLDLSSYVNVLGDMTERLVVLGGAAESAAPRARILARVIGTEYGFTGDRQTYDDPDNADLIRVMDRRRGLPVSLTILYVAAARRLGWQADALNTPGHVVARIGSETEPVLIDPFDGGAVLDAERFASLLHAVLGRGAAPRPEHLTPMSNRSVLVRLLMNQASRAEARGDPGRALTLFERMTVIAPSTAHAWWEQARLQLHKGDVESARASLSAMLEVTREPELRMHACAALDALSGER